MSEEAIEMIEMIDPLVEPHTGDERADQAAAVLTMSGWAWRWTVWAMPAWR